MRDAPPDLPMLKLHLAAPPRRAAIFVAAAVVAVAAAAVFASMHLHRTGVAGTSDTDAPTTAASDDAGPAAVDKHGKPVPPPDPGVVMRRLLQLRTQNRFDEAMALLRSASRNRGYSAVQRERFGFELCNLVTQTKDSAKACSCWQRHMRAFPESDRAAHLPEALHGCR